MRQSAAAEPVQPPISRLVFVADRLARRAWPLLAACVLSAGCGRPAPSASAPSANPPAVPATPVDVRTGPPGTGNVTAQPSEFIAQNKADPNCPDCQKGDTTQGARYFGKPDMPLDAQTLEDVRATIEATSAILEHGVTLLEQNQKQPEKAAAAIEAYRKKSAAELARVFERAREVKARLAAAGYDQDIPAELAPYVEERMGKVLQRLEAMRDVYRKHPDALTAFSGLIPRMPK